MNFLMGMRSQSLPEITPLLCVMAKAGNHYAIIGMAHVAGNYPLYYDAINEKGLGIAGLNFVGNATYKPVNPDSDKKQITQFELIPFILGTCASLKKRQKKL